MTKLGAVRITITLLPLLLAACATQGPSRYMEEEARLRAACEAKGGMWLPRGGVRSGNPGADNICDIRQATRIPRSGG